jgi:hypothetical protein
MGRFYNYWISISMLTYLFGDACLALPLWPLRHAAEPIRFARGAVHTAFCAYFLRPHLENQPFILFRWLDAGYERFRRGFVALLRVAVKLRWLTVMVALGMVLLAITIFLIMVWHRHLLDTLSIRKIQRLAGVKTLFSNRLQTSFINWPVSIEQHSFQKTLNPVLPW